MSAAGTIATAAAAFACGTAAGLVYYAAVRKSVSALAAQRGWAAPLALTLGRLLGIAALLVLAAHLGAAALLGAFAGFCTARIRSLRRAWRPG